MDCQSMHLRGIAFPQPNPSVGYKTGDGVAVLKTYIFICNVGAGSQETSAVGEFNNNEHGTTQNMKRLTCKQTLLPDDY